MDLHLYLLGPVQVKLADEYVEVKPRKALALLIYLAVTGERHARDSLATLLWPDSDQRRSRKSLRSRLSELNQVLGSGWIKVDRESVGLCSGYWLDVAEFQRFLTEGTNDPQPLISAIELYRDDFLSGFTLPDCPGFDEWQYFQTEGLRQALASALEKLAGILSKQGDFETAVPYARRWLALDPLHEPAHQQLMRLYAQTGQQAAALRQFEQCRRALEKELGIAPSPETEALYQDIQAGNLVPEKKKPPPQHNLPVQTSTFIGREGEIADLKQLLLEEPGCRLLTLVGPGGIGKTRLALATAVQLRDVFPDGVFFIPLAPVSEVAFIIQAIAESLHLIFHGNVEPKAHLLDYLSQRQLLLVVDNLEHLLDGATLLFEIISQAPRVLILATSRERLNLQEEWVFNVRGLEFPSDDGRASDTFSAVELFLQRARQTMRGFAPTKEDFEYIDRVCQLVDGMPLGIELAAPWIKVLSCREIATEIERNLEFLKTTVQNVPDRHRSLQVVFEQTWERLSEEEKSALRYLSVFRGGCTREAAEQVAGATLPILYSLVDKALLHRTNEGRLEMHELLRQFSSEKLALKREHMADAQDRHCTYYSAFLAERESPLRGAGQKMALSEIADDIDNIRISWQWAVSKGNIEAINQSLECLGNYYETKSRYSEGFKLFGLAAEKSEEILEKLDTSNQNSQGITIKITIAGILAWFGFFNYRVHFFNEARELGQKSIDLLREIGPEGQGHMALPNLLIGQIYFWERDLEKARKHYQNCLTASGSVQDQWGISEAYLSLGEIAAHEDNYADAESYTRSGLAISEAIGDQKGIVWGLLGLSRIALSLENYDEVNRLGQKSLIHAQEIDHPQGTLYSLLRLGNANRELGKYELSKGHFRDALAVALEIHSATDVFNTLIDYARLMFVSEHTDSAKVRAIELVALVHHHPISRLGGFREDAARYLDLWQRQLPKEKAQIAQARGESLELFTTARDLLAELSS